MTRLITLHRLRKTCEPSPLWQVATPKGSFPVCVPGSLSLPGVQDDCATVVYEKKLTCAGTIRLVFGGASCPAAAELDGQPLATGDVPGQPFSGVAEALAYGTHTLTVSLDHADTEGGLIRPVTIEQLGSAYIAALHVTPLMKGRIPLCAVSLDVQSLTDEEQRIALDVTVGSAAIHWKDRLLPPHGTLTLTGTVAVPGMKRWSPEHPQLYPTEAVLWLAGEPGDDLCGSFGFRTTDVQHDVLMLNGKPFDLRRGSYVSQDYETVEALLRAVLLLKEQGCNAVQLEGFPDPRFLDLCDRLGLLVWAQGAEDGHACVVAD